MIRTITLDLLAYRETYLRMFRYRWHRWRSACARDVAEDAAYNLQDRWITPRRPRYDSEQKPLVTNHVALVDASRAPPGCTWGPVKP
jgi:hypothetical protein